MIDIIVMECQNTHMINVEEEIIPRITADISEKLQIIPATGIVFL